MKVFSTQEIANLSEVELFTGRIWGRGSMTEGYEIYEVYWQRHEKEVDKGKLGENYKLLREKGELRDGI